MKSIFIPFLVIFCILQDHQGSCMFLQSCKEIVDNSTLQRLKEYLFCSYDEEVRPVSNHRNAIDLQFALNIHQFEVDELANTVDFHVWTKLIWTDSHLTWEPLQFDDIKWLHVMSHEMWVPDIVSHSVSNVDVNTEIPRVECGLHFMGVVVCTPMLVYTTFCESDHTWWPYDSMNCSLYIASWSHSTDEIDIRFVDVDSKNERKEDIYDDSLEWELVHISQTERLVESKFGVEFTSKMLCYHIILQRYSSTYTSSYMTMVLALMTMTLMVLWLDPRSTERMVVANFNFILHLICLQDLQWKLPYNGNYPPKLIFFYENSLVLAAFSLILTSILRHVQELNTDAPAWLSSVTISILKSRVGQVFLISILDPKVSASMERNTDDNTNLVSFDRKESTWKYTSILIGWIAFFSVLFVYVIMLALFLPTSNSAKTFVANT
ncbi:neuronal acetylcholine receptor subunit alpha-6-like [Osmia bicornis bicornis]|uniref:neuronal acetylcholine receptor subunit alpha-6-like n=1 Tax=Osmia bicornis bicornis TaxID=1437191 RepID=UPI001EAEE567|nr:neuronal acetylcholine receptor subunit alpha-6-like [Osmia bicornis bicornis]